MVIKWSRGGYFGVIRWALVGFGGLKGGLWGAELGITGSFAGYYWVHTSAHFGAHKCTLWDQIWDYVLIVCGVSVAALLRDASRKHGLPPTVPP